MSNSTVLLFTAIKIDSKNPYWHTHEISILCAHAGARTQHLCFRKHVLSYIVMELCSGNSPLYSNHVNICSHTGQLWNVFQNSSGMRYRNRKSNSISVHWPLSQTSGRAVVRFQISVFLFGWSEVTLHSFPLNSNQILWTFSEPILLPQGDSIMQPFVYSLTHLYIYNLYLWIIYMPSVAETVQA
jgi:hypothetical protein